MYVGNVLLLILNLPLIGLWVRLLRIRPSMLLPLIMAFSMTGVFAVNNNVTEVLVMLFFGVVGYAMRKGGFPAAPVVLLHRREERVEVDMEDGADHVRYDRRAGADTATGSPESSQARGRAWKPGTGWKMRVEGSVPVSGALHVTWRRPPGFSISIPPWMRRAGSSREQRNGSTSLA